MTYSTLISRVKRRQIAQLISKGKRLDGRGLTDHREIRLDTGIIENAEGSSRIRLGKTDVMVGIKIEVGVPFSDLPDMGVLTVNAELVPLASPTFEPGPPGEDSIELARVVDRGIRESKAIELEKLCPVSGKKAFIIFVDIYVLNHDGNLIDASSMATLASLFNTKAFNFEVENGEVIRKLGYTQLPVRSHPLAFTFAKIEDKLILDPSLVEEQVMEARLTITVDSDGNICAMQKGGSGYFIKRQISEAIGIAQEKYEDLKKVLADNG